jgi:hypothetical protein
MRWLDGKKTYIAAGLLVVLGGFGFWTGKAGDVVSTAIVLLAVGLFGLGDKAERYGRAITAALTELKSEVRRHPGAGMSLNEVKELARKALSPEDARRLFESGALDAPRGGHS